MSNPLRDSVLCNVPLQACVLLYPRRTASTLRISSRPSVWRMAEASLPTALAVTDAQPAPPPIPPPMATELVAAVPRQTRARRPLREMNGTEWSVILVMTLKLSDVVWTRREWRHDIACKGSGMTTNPQTNSRHKLNTDLMKVVLSTDPRLW